MKIAFIGFGGVGQALVKILRDRRQKLADDYDMNATIVAVSDIMKGSVYDPNGLDEDHLLDTIAEYNHLDYYPDTASSIKGWDSLKTIKQSNADVIIEVTFTDVKTGQPAIDHCRMAFENNKSIVTTNKGPVALAFQELSQVAKKQNVYWGFEGTVMSGTPALRLPFTTLAGNEITEIKGILNGTTNFMLTEMEKGLSYQDALALAQTNGYAEADPTNDVEGFDARYKTVILSNVVMNAPMKPDDVMCEGISGLTLNDLEIAIENDQRWRLVARIKKEGQSVTASVKPELLHKNDPLATVMGSTNAIVYDCDLAGPVMLTGAGAGLMETGYSLLIDLIHYQKDKVMMKQ
ncbi:homoserine dehydrogenase [Salisediminibacterium beveridgei]|uniref:Homoserine dehydrogenase n=1 Tax=Salisediminibacterium beveridgei TaxID=632773 RepID=A0A1D7QV75_9BACI|nr:homoserine dehydrogenase [Salisediminibacterium beveridgei]AOM82911.1 Homoserine dehydrogenase [Salisediminibacterium beveridgei]